MLPDNSNAFYNLLCQDDTLVLQAKTPLARLWRLSLTQLGITRTHWDLKMAEYRRRALKHFVASGHSKEYASKQAVNLKGNIPKGLVLDNISFNRLCQGYTVLNFPKIIFRMTFYKGDDVITIAHPLPELYENAGNGLLKQYWDELNSHYPEITENWTSHLKDFKKWLAEEEGEEVANDIGGGLTQALKSNEITWKVFYQGIQVHQFDKIKLELLFYHKRNVDDAEVIQLVINKV